MFEGFETRIVPGAGADIFCRIAGSGPPLLLLHGYPQTGAMWAGIAPRLAERFTVVVADLRGYGQSSQPDSRSGEHYAKRSMSNDMAAAMRELGHERFHLAGHDRGGRVAYRLALDHPEAVSRLAVLDIVPTLTMWERMDAARALSGYHWSFLAQPNPLPERLIGADPVFYLDHTLASWTASHSTSAFSPEALSEYRRAFNRPEAIHAACEDYRAGATIDRTHDEADRAANRRIAAPVLAIWGADGTPAKGGDPLDAWRPWVAGDLDGVEVPGGHFVVEEAPEDTLAALLAFFGR
ncbi:alpha/beta fold hydrolase [Aureimonas jatrophae]|uniref:Haloacetate dehalogenase n=1 Tax=Aureimonas jatrophae TaxID=1166073 RepID=A0A1H0HY62_9HYPH|nr:alpha/beta hydrolase [Aureimonas jatrophae]MBB3950839.1 haloacetate dehalogenase [Aureimonas jatrophae]SDO24099.1 haloacetate dehalogenase [Aureimonas jatrophae]